MVLGRISKMALSEWKKRLFFNSASLRLTGAVGSPHASGYCLKIRGNFGLYFMS